LYALASRGLKTLTSSAAQYPSNPVSGNFWVGFETGIGGLRGLRITGDDIKSPDTDVGSSWYVAVDIKLRAGVLE
jgi:hypothetical protein